MNTNPTIDQAEYTLARRKYSLCFTNIFTLWRCSFSRVLFTIGMVIKWITFASNETGMQTDFYCVDSKRFRCIANFMSILIHASKLLMRSNEQYYHRSYLNLVVPDFCFNIVVWTEKGRFKFNPCYLAEVKAAIKMHLNTFLTTSCL